MNIIQRLLCENEILNGRIEVYERVMGVFDSRVNEITNLLSGIKHRMDGMV